MIDESLEYKRRQYITDGERLRLFSVNYTEKPNGKVKGQRKSKLYHQGALMGIILEIWTIISNKLHSTGSRECFR